MIRIKVCGLRHLENIQAVAELHPDYMGFIFYEKSKRYVGNDFIVPRVDHSIIKVGVFVNERMEEVIRLTKMNSINYLQLHGDESVSYCKKLKDAGYTIIKAFSVSSDFDFTLLNAYKKVCSYFLFDTKGESYGGNGKAFDWSLLKKYDQEIPFFLSGGLSLANAESALSLRDLNLHALDVNSGFEITPGIKNISNLEELFIVKNHKAASA
jgi:phosphoribosylanthranilate isomerase